MDDPPVEPKRQSLYTPSPFREAKRSKSEEQEAEGQVPVVPPRALSYIGDQLADLKDLSDDFNSQQSQVRWLLWQTAERQRQEASTKISVKNWWKYELKGNKEHYLLEDHRKHLFEHYAKEAGVPDKKQQSFQYSNYMGKRLSPFCVIDVGDARTRMQILEHMKSNHGSKINEWIADSMKTDMAALPTDKFNKTGVNGKLVFEPMIATFDKLQSIPLKIAMSTIAELRPDLSWSKNWAQHTLYVPDAQGGTDTYLVWCAMDHLHGKCDIYFNEGQFDKQQFKECFQKHEYTLLAQKGWGKGKGRVLSTAGSLSKEEMIDPNGAFMDQIGLSSKSSNASSSKTYTSALEKATKSEVPFRMKVRPLAGTDFVKTYNSHLHHLLSRWS